MRHLPAHGPYLDYDVFVQTHELRLDMEDLQLFWRGEPHRVASLGHASTDDRIIMFRGVVNASIRWLSGDFVKRLKEEGVPFNKNKVRIVIEGHYWRFHFRAEVKDQLLIYGRAEHITPKIFNRSRSYNIISISTTTLESSRMALERHELIRGIKTICNATAEDRVTRSVPWLLQELHSSDSFQLQSFQKTEKLLAHHAVFFNKWLKIGIRRSCYPDRKLFSQWADTKAKAIRSKTGEEDLPYILPSIEAWMKNQKWFEHIDDRFEQASDPLPSDEDRGFGAASPLEAQADSDDEEVQSESSELGFERSRTSSPELGGPVPARKSRTPVTRESSPELGDVSAVGLPSSPELEMNPEALKRFIRPRPHGTSRQKPPRVSTGVQHSSRLSSEGPAPIDSEMEVDAAVEAGSEHDDMEGYLTSLRKSPQYQSACRERLPKDIWKAQIFQPNTFRLRWVCPLPSLEFPHIRQCDCLFEVNFHKDEFLPEFKDLLSERSWRYLRSAMEDPGFNELRFFADHRHNPYQPALAEIVRAHNYWHYWQFRVGTLGGTADDGAELLIKLENATSLELKHIKQRLDRKAMLYKYEPGTVINLADMVHKTFWNVEIAPVRPGSDAP